MTTGERIKLRRVEMGLSLRELAKRMGYSNQSTISRIETGAIDIPQSRIVQFAEVLGVSVAYLMGWEAEEEKPTIQADDGLTENQRRLMQFVKAVPDSKAEMVLRVMKSIVETD